VRMTGFMRALTRIVEVELFHLIIFGDIRLLIYISKKSQFLMKKFVLDLM